MMRPVIAVGYLVAVAGCSKPGSTGAPGSHGIAGRATTAAESPVSHAAAFDTTGWLVGATPTQDFLTAEVTEAMLREHFGPGAVASDSVAVGEGFYEAGTTLFPRSRSRRLQILWADEASRAHPRIVFVRNDSTSWRVYPG